MWGSSRSSGSSLHCPLGLHFQQTSSIVWCSPTTPGTACALHLLTAESLSLAPMRHVQNMHLLVKSLSVTPTAQGKPSQACYAQWQQPQCSAANDTAHLPPECQFIQRHEDDALVAERSGACRALETEADKIGLMLAARACYKPAAFIPVMTRLGEEDRKSGLRSPEFLRTHPMSDTRIQQVCCQACAAAGHDMLDGCSHRCRAASTFCIQGKTAD